jgi:formylglycine-generating enzyme required for sulfatase activity
MQRKILITVLLLMVGMTSPVMGQDDCYNPTMRAAKSAFDKGNYRRAEKLYKEAADCYDCTPQQKAQAKRKAEESRKRMNTVVDDDRPRPESITMRVGGVEFKMVWVEGGTFTMGCTAEKGEVCYNAEKPAHSVTLSSYYMGETEVTQALWEAVMGNNPSRWKGDNLPVEQVSWKDVQVFIEKLNRLTGRKFRLPTEAEWEYAARGGGKSKGYKISGSNIIDAVAWYESNSGSKTHIVKWNQSNELGLYDMTGNVWEWCSDWYGDYSPGAQQDPEGPSTGSSRVCRGGSWLDFARDCRVWRRFMSNPSDQSSSHGFRLVLVP